MLENKCEKCNKIYKIRPYLLGRSRFCGRSCMNADKRNKPIKHWLTRKPLSGSSHPNWKGGLRRKGSRFTTLMVNGKYAYRNRQVAEKCIGRKLLDREVIHHIDENKSNDSPSNLFRFRHRSAHVRWHAFLKRHKLSGVLLTSNL